MAEIADAMEGSTAVADSKYPSAKVTGNRIESQTIQDWNEKQSKLIQSICDKVENNKILHQVKQEMRVQKVRRSGLKTLLRAPKDQDPIEKNSQFIFSLLKQDQDTRNHAQPDNTTTFPFNTSFYGQ